MDGLSIDVCMFKIQFRFNILVVNLGLKQRTAKLNIVNWTMQGQGRVNIDKF